MAKLRVTFLITGGLVGAGILALPVNTGLAGFIPSIVTMIIVGAAMLISAFIIAEESIEDREARFDLPTIYGKHLGSAGKWVAVAANLFIMYGFLVAYLTGATTIIVNLIKFPMPQPLVLLIFFAVITYVTIKGVHIVSKHSSVLVVLMLISFVILLIMSGKHVVPERLTYTDWSFAPETVPIIIAAFYFHNIIPQASGALDWKRRSIVTAIVIGMAISIVMNLAWIRAGIGSLPLTGGENSLLYAYQNNLPATIPMAKEIHSPFFLTNSLIFALLAISTSYLGFGTALLGFTSDLTKNHFKKESRPFEIALAFAPPLAVSLIYPDIFLTVLNIVGGIGVALLFGILPSVIVIKKSRSLSKKIWGIALLLIFSLFMLFEFGQEFGFLRLQPKAEYWTGADKLTSSR